MKTILKVLALTALLAVLCPGQTVTLSTTTLGAAVTATNQTTLTLAATTGMYSAGPANLVNTALYVGRELITVVSVVDSTHVTVQRGKQSTRPLLYPSGDTVWFASTTNGIPALNFFSNVQPTAEVWPGDSCTSTQETVLPRVYVTSGHFFDCLGSQWVQTNVPGHPVLGTTVASPAGAMTLTGTILTVSGTNAVTGINVPNGWAPGMSVYLLPSGAFTTTTAGNIAIASTAVVGKTLIMTWSGSKWNPSY